MTFFAKQFAAAGLLAGLLLPHLAGASGSMRCGSRLVSEGMLAAEAVAICGEPDFRDVWPPPAPYGYGALGQIEEWVYNRGSSQLLRVLRVRNGRIERILTEGYGFAQPSRSPCGQTDIVPGMSKYRLLSRCGEPIARITDYVLYPEPQHRRHGWQYEHPNQRDYYNAVSPVFREEWTYNFGSSRLLRIVTLENGRVTDVRSGRRGFNP
jgi:hypothetical protein